MIKGKSSNIQPEFQLLGNGDMEESIAATVSGYLVPKVDMLSRVKKDQLLGEILGPANELLEEIKSPHNGVIVLIRRSPAVTEGESTFLVTGEVS
jgi:predicted deacylase